MKIMYCQHCGKECKVPPVKEKAFRFCSMECRSAALGWGKKVTKICDYCGKPFDTDPSKAKLARTRFCSKECQKKGVGEESYTRAGKTAICVICGKEFPKPKGRKRNQTCSADCTNKLKGIRSTGRIITGKTAKKCAVCGAEFEVFPSRDYYQYCSNKCKRIGISQSFKKRPNSKVTLSCFWCGKPVIRLGPSRIKKHTFCSNECYHAWDSEQKRANPDKALKHLKDTCYFMSRIEDQVAAWLRDKNIRFSRQTPIGKYLVDFWVNNQTAIEVNGCYWHGCSVHFPVKTKEQINRVKRDTVLTAYCEENNIPLIFIWEHDIENGDFSTLQNLLIAPHNQATSTSNCVP